MASEKEGRVSERPFWLYVSLPGVSLSWQRRRWTAPSAAQSSHFRRVPGRKKNAASTGARCEVRPASSDHFFAEFPVDYQRYLHSNWTMGR